MICVDAKMRRCGDEKVICVDVKMRRSADEKMRYRPPLLEEPFSQNALGKNINKGHANASA